MGLIAHYRLDGSAEDAVGDKHGSASSAVWADGKLGKAADMRSSNWWITGDGWKINSDFSYSFWAIQTNNGDTGSAGLVGNHYHTGGPTGCNIYMVGGTSGIRVATGDGVDRPVYTLAVPYPTNEWQHYAITYKGRTVSVYQNGVHIDSRDRDIKFDPSRPFAIGRWTASYDSYYLNGMIDDVRIYDHALSPREVRDLSLGLLVHLPLSLSYDDSQGNITLPNAGGSFTGDHVTFDGSEPTPNVSGVGYSSQTVSISFWGRLSGAGKNYAFDTRYSRSCLFKWEDGVTDKVLFGVTGTYRSYVQGNRLGEWVHYCLIADGTYEKFYVDGVLVGQWSQGTGTVTFDTFYLANYQSGGYTLNGGLRDFRIYVTALTAAQAKELYQQRASIDSEGSVHSGGTYETGYSPVIGPSYEAWTAGTTGAEPGFGTNGSASKSSRVIDDGPHGEQAVLWRATNTDTSSTADGGWNSATFPIDNTKTYRFSVWMRRRVQGNGSSYWGTHGYGSVNGVYPLGTSTPNTNPYFWSGGANESWGWFLIVGHIHPAGYTGPTHPDSARYTKDGYLGPISNDFVWLPETTSANHRAYLYYSTDLSTVQDMAYPRVDLCDGTEPTIQQLIDGFDLRWAQNGFPKELSVRNQLMLPRSSEVGVTRGLVAWYPLIGDDTDLANNSTVSSSLGTGYASGGGNTGANFDTTDYLGYSLVDAIPAGDPWTFGCSVYLRDFSSSSSYPIFLSAGLPYLAVTSSGSSLRCSYRGPSGQTDVGSSASLTAGKWHDVRVTFDPSEGVKLFLDGSQVGHNPDPHTSTFDAMRVGGHGSSYMINGIIRDVRIHNVALTPEEVAIQAKLALNQATKSAMTQSCLYTKGQIKEVIA